MWGREAATIRAVMFAIDHAATALLIKRRFPQTPMLWLLMSVQLMELLWVVLNFLGVERTTTAAAVHTVSEIQLAYMPYSHSVASGALLALLAWLAIGKGLHRPIVGLAVGFGILSHLILDFITHAPDIALAPGVSERKLGLGLYSAAPMVAFFLEIAYGVLCWRFYRGGYGLLAAIVLFNVANLSMFSAAVPGPEEFLAGRPTMIVTVIAIQIALTLTAVGVLSKSKQELA